MALLQIKEGEKIIYVNPEADKINLLEWNKRKELLKAKAQRGNAGPEQK